MKKEAILEVVLATMNALVIKNVDAMIIVLAILNVEVADAIAIAVVILNVLVTIIVVVIPNVIVNGMILTNVIVLILVRGAEPKNGKTKL